MKIIDTVLQVMSFLWIIFISYVAYIFKDPEAINLCYFSIIVPALILSNYIIEYSSIKIQTLWN